MLQDYPSSVLKCQFLRDQIELIETDLIQQEVPIYQRAPLALARLEAPLGLSLPTAPPHDAIEDDDFSPQAVSVRVYQWYEIRYGARSRKPFAIGQVATWIQGDIYCVHIPLNLSGEKLKTLTSCYGPLPDSVAPITEYQLLDLVEGLTLATYEEINRGRGYEVLNTAMALDMGTRAFLPLHLMRAQIPLFNEALGDLNASAFHLFERAPRLGHSRWASLQAVEKTLKGFLREHASEKHLRKKAKGQPERWDYGHDLTRLCNLCEAYGMMRPPQACIDFVQCDQSVRYSECETSLEETLNAHVHALQLVGGAAYETARLLNIPLPDVPEMSGEFKIRGRTVEASLHEILEIDARERELQNGRKSKRSSK